MPDLLTVFSKRWKFILLLTIIATVIAFFVAMVSPKKFLATATALPANSVIADKARMFNTNIEVLYSDFGTPDELDRLEGTGTLDTIFIATANELKLASHYEMGNDGEGPFKAAMELKKNSRISRSAYGELKIKVWDEDRNMSAAMANQLLQNIQEIHQQMQNENNLIMVEQLTHKQQQLNQEYKSLSDSLSSASGAEAEIINAKKAALLDQLQQYEKMLGQYQLAVNTNPQVLLTVENARAPLWPDKPRIIPTVLLTLFGAFIFGFIISVLIEGRK